MLIRDEAVDVLTCKEEGFSKYIENVHPYQYNVEYNKWNNFTLFYKGKKIEENCLKMPITCSIIEKIPELNTNHQTEGLGRVMLRFVFYINVPYSTLFCRLVCR